MQIAWTLLVVVGMTAFLAFSISSAKAHDGYASQIDALTPIGYWRLDELDGRIARDCVGSYHGWIEGPAPMGMQPG